MQPRLQESVGEQIKGNNYRHNYVFLRLGHFSLKIIHPSTVVHKDKTPNLCNVRNGFQVCDYSQFTPEGHYGNITASAVTVGYLVVNK